MEKKTKFKILLLPILVSFIVTICVLFIDENIVSETITPSTQQIVSLSVLLFLGIYFFIITLVLPIDLFISKKTQNRIIAFILFNVVGLIFAYVIETWFFTSISFISIYFIFPVFSILSLIRMFVYNAD